MIYEKWLKKNKGYCPFCNLKESEIIKKEEDIFLIIAKAPYTKDHLLIVPKEHKTKISQLTNSELNNLNKLVSFAFKKMSKIYQDVSILYREGEKIGKSIDHLHVHIIPKMKIGTLKKESSQRKMLSDKKYLKELEIVKKRLFKKSV